MPDIPLRNLAKGFSAQEGLASNEGGVGFHDTSKIIDRILSIQIPFSNTPSQELYGGGTNTYYSFDVNDIDGFDIEFYSDKNEFGTVLSYLEDWKALVIDPSTGLRGFPKGDSGYKKSLELVLRKFRSDSGADRLASTRFVGREGSAVSRAILGSGESDIVLRYQLNGIFPTETAMIDLNVSSDPVTLTQSFSIDSASYLRI